MNDKIYYFRVADVDAIYAYCTRDIRHGYICI